jgi:hypothetical protein
MTDTDELIEYDIERKLNEIPLFKISCSQISKIIGEGRAKSFKDKIAAQELQIKETKSKVVPEKSESKTQQNLTAKIERLELGLKELNELDEAQKNLPKLSETAKTYCKNWLKGFLYEKRKTFTSKYTDKGNEKEEDAIDYCERVFEGADGWFLASKNTERRSNQWVEGECDIELTDEIKDIKNSFDFSTFPLIEDEIPTIDYYWQLQGYMWLWDKEKGGVIYVLMDLPDEMIMKEVWREFGYGFAYTQQQFDDFTAQFRYEHLPRQLRIKEYKFERDDEKIELIKTKVGECRKYIDILVNNLKKQLNG